MAHTVANRIHRLILEKFLYRVLEDTDVDYDEHMDDSEDADEDLTDNDATDDQVMSAHGNRQSHAKHIQGSN